MEPTASRGQIARYPPPPTEWFPRPLGSALCLADQHRAFFASGHAPVNVKLPN